MSIPKMVSGNHAMLIWCPKTIMEASYEMCVPYNCYAVSGNYIVFMLVRENHIIWFVGTIGFLNGSQKPCQYVVWSQRLIVHSYGVEELYCTFIMVVECNIVRLWFPGNHVSACYGIQKP